MTVNHSKNRTHWKKGMVILDVRNAKSIDKSFTEIKWERIIRRKIMQITSKIFLADSVWEVRKVGADICWRSFLIRTDLIVSERQLENCLNRYNGHLPWTQAACKHTLSKRGRWKLKSRILSSRALERENSLKEQ